jgi:predicted N-acetyltransferase YhbS
MRKFTVQIADTRQSIDEIIEFLARIFGPNYHEARRIQDTLLRTEPTTRPENFVAARSADGSLIGIVRIVERKIGVRRAVLHCGGLSSISVHPDWRHRGVTREMMRVACDAMTARGMDLAYLHGRRAMDGYYTRFGYSCMNRYLDLEVLSSPAFDTLRLDPCKPAEMKVIDRFYEQSYSALSGSIVRSKDIWQFLFARNASMQDAYSILLCRRGREKRPVGYIVRSGDRVVEVAAPERMYSSLAAALCRSGVRQISIHPHHGFFRYLRSTSTTVLHERFSVDGGYLGRILNPESVLNKLAGGVCERASQIGLRKETMHLGGFRMALGGGAVQRAQAPNDVVFQHEGQFLDLLLGRQPADAQFGMRYRSGKSWIGDLFPATGFHTCAWDEI